MSSTIENMNLLTLFFLAVQLVSLTMGSPQVAFPNSGGRKLKFKFPEAQIPGGLNENPGGLNEPLDEVNSRSSIPMNRPCSACEIRISDGRCVFSRSACSGRQGLSNPGGQDEPQLLFSPIPMNRPCSDCHIRVSGGRCVFSRSACGGRRRG